MCSGYQEKGTASVRSHRRTKCTICSDTGYGKDPLTLSGVSCNRGCLPLAGIGHRRSRKTGTPRGEKSMWGGVIVSWTGV